MPHLHKSGKTSDGNLSSGARLTPIQREAAIAAAEVAKSVAEVSVRRTSEVYTWLSFDRALLPVGVAVARSAVVTAGNNLGYTTGEVNSTIAKVVASGRLDQQGNNLVRRF